MSQHTGSGTHGGGGGGGGPQLCTIVVPTTQVVTKLAQVKLALATEEEVRARFEEADVDGSGPSSPGRFRVPVCASFRS